jgi:hypothetical protein
MTTRTKLPTVDTATCLRIFRSPEGLFLVEGSIGEMYGTLVLDTASGPNLIDSAAALKLGLESQSELVGLSMNGSERRVPMAGPIELKLGKHPWHGLVGVFDIAGAADWSGTVLGAVGAAFFINQPAIFNLGANELWIGLTENVTKTPERNVPLRLVKYDDSALDVLALALDSEGKDHWLLLDSGASVSLLRGARLPTVLWLDTHDNQSSPLRLGDQKEKILSPITFSKHLRYDGVLGAPFFNSVKFVLDLKAQRLILLD